MTTPQTKNFNGDFLLYRKDGQKLRAKFGGSPRFRHKTMASAETEAARLLDIHPASTFIILQEVGRVKLKEVASPEAIAWAEKMADEVAAEPASIVIKCRRAGCVQRTAHPSGMCEEHRPGFAQSDSAEAA